jgi:folate-binding protein YgfZ
MRTASEVISLDDLGIVRARGTDAVRFLQGQLSNDLTRLGPENSLLAGYHNPQGRAIALLRLVQWETDDILAVVPRELAPMVASRLGKFVLRAKVKITDESGAWRINGVTGTPELAPGPGVAAVRVGDEPRWLVISPVDSPVPESDSAVGAPEAWLRLDIAAGQPQVYAATSEEFVAQMLNLDALNAIAFDKGCYTGQEVIARAHYRGRVKRRMQRFVSRASHRLAPGDSGQLADGRTFKVVLAAQLADGRCDFLAVAPLAGAEREEAGTATGSPTLLAVDQVPLPYALPD